MESREICNEVLKGFKVSFDKVFDVKHPTRASIKKELECRFNSFETPVCYGVRYSDEAMQGGFSTYGRRFFIHGRCFEVEKSLVDKYAEEFEVPTYNRNKYITVVRTKFGFISPLDMAFVSFGGSDAIAFETDKIETHEQLGFVLKCFKENRPVDMVQFGLLGFKQVG